LAARRHTQKICNVLSKVLTLTLTQDAPLSAVQKDSSMHEPEEEKQLIDLLSSIIVDTVLNKKSYEKKEHHLPALQQ
jgi:hypothetical protein